MDEADYEKTEGGVSLVIEVLNAKMHFLKIACLSLQREPYAKPKSSRSFTPPPATMVSKSTPVFPIVGIGASAGGLEAFEQFFRSIPVDSGMAFVLVQHLDPSHASLLTEILQRTTAMPVVEALDQLQVEPNSVYVIPPNCDLAIFHGALQLSLPDQARGLRMPIDTFLRSLAEDQQNKAIGIILSGTGTDGTLGLRAILGAGGISLVQEPTTAKYDGMPTSAINAGYANYVLPIDQMLPVLLTGGGSISLPIAPTTKAANGINAILMQLRNLTGHDFSLYKKNTINRRIERRMLQYGIDDTNIYARYLKENPAEARILFKDMLINVTNFFRDPEAFAALKATLLPLCQAKPEGYPFRVWVAGCSTGEEAYSIAMLLCELMDSCDQDFNVQIYSTDLDDSVIAVARAGIYPPNIAQDVSAERLRRFFIKEENGFRVKKELRDRIVFAVQNVIKDPPFTKLDVLSCRNLLIYLEPALQDWLIPVFNYALKPDGVLFLSPSEGISNHTDLFTVINRKCKLYRAITTSPLRHTLTANPSAWAAAQSSGLALPNSRISKPKTINFAELTRRLLVQYYAPASVLTNLNGDLLHVHGETGYYLRPAPGQPSLNVIEMARQGLAVELRKAISTAAEGHPTLNRELQVKSNGSFSKLSLSVRHLPATGGQALLLISFQAITAANSKLKQHTRSDPVGQIEQLEDELAYLKEAQQANIEEQRIANEELKSANEELQSTNEELQSSNEELETSREELQSLNEELITVNSELQVKMEQLSGMQNDMKNLLDSISIGIIFLDRNLTIRRFTREATRVYRLVASDVDRPLNDIKTVVSGDDLVARAVTVLESLLPYESELPIDNDASMLVRIQPFRTLDNIIDGVVLTFTDISVRVSAVMAQQQALTLADSIINTIREPFLVLDSNLKVISASPSFYREFQVTAETTLGQRIYNLGNHQWDIPALRELLETVLPNNQTFAGYQVAHDFPGIGHRKLVLDARYIAGKTGAPHLILLSMELQP